jgi:hypothetical protein
MDEKKNYINKRWSKEVMQKRLENLKKILPLGVVELQIELGKQKAEDELDALYIAYYALKDIYCKVKRNSFGTPNEVEYKPKCLLYRSFYEYNIPSEYYTTLYSSYNTATYVTLDNTATVTYTYNTGDLGWTTTNWIVNE